MTMPRAEVITSVQRRRRWPREEKERLVAASLEPGASVSEVARAAGLHVSQLFKWRKDLCQRGETRVAPLEAVEVVSSRRPGDAAEPPLTRVRAQHRRREGIIEIELGSGYRIVVDGDVDGDALRRVVDALARR